MMQQAALLLCALAAAAVETTYPMSYTSCGVTHTLQESPSRVVTMNQGVTEFLLAMGLEDKMAGTAYLDDEIWPRYAAAYAGIPVLSSSYPNETTIMNANADFITGSYRSAFRERRTNATTGAPYGRGIFSGATVGPCDGANSDFFPSGSNATTSYSTCRPQLHAAGIGTWLEPGNCDDSALNPQGGVSEETVYEAITQMGAIFNVPHVAKQLVSEIRNDFSIAEQALANSGHKLNAVWLDCVGCCGDPWADEYGNVNELLFVGAGTGAPNLIMHESGLTNMFAALEGGWACVNASDVLAAEPDVMIIVDAAWDTAISKIDYLHGRSDFCGARFVQQADYIKIPFSASTLGPRNGAAALDMVAAAIHVTTGDATMNFQSGVDFFEPEVLAERTASLLCPVELQKVAYTGTPPPPAPTPPPPVGSTSNDDLPAWGVVVIVVVGVLFIAVLAFAGVMYYRERQGRPIFVSLEGVQAERAAQQTSTQKA